MYLKRLEINGFKSFAKKTTLEFNTPVTAIVGPNGSGKSNILEAFRFVLGEQSIKSMRGKKGEDLIWNGGGDGGSRSNRASAKVVFDNSKRLFNIDFDEVSIERVVYRDSISEYLINGSQVRLKDVLEMLSQAHIGPSGHHIISQGEADRILLSTPKERKEMIEDALGLKIYQYKKKDSQKKLEKAEENIKSAEALRKEILPHLRFLKKQVEKIERAIVLKKELKELFAKYLDKEYIYMLAMKYKAKISKETALAKLKSIEFEISGVKKGTINTISQEKLAALSEIQRRYALVRSKKESLERELGNIEGQISILQKQEQTVNQDLYSKNVPVEMVENLLSQAEERLNAAENGVINNIYELVANLRQIFDKFLHILKTDEKKRISSNSDLERLFTLKKGKEEELDKIHTEENQLFSEERRLAEELSIEKEKNLKAEKDLLRLSVAQREAYNELNDADSLEAKAKYTEENLTREIEDVRSFLGSDMVEVVQSRSRPAEGENLLMPSEEELKAQEELRKSIERLKAKIEEVGGVGSSEVLKEFKETSDRDAFLEKEIQDLKASALTLKGLINELNAKIEEDFKEGVAKINDQFDFLFKLMFGGGKASLKVVYEKNQDNDADKEEEAELDYSSNDDAEMTPGIILDIQLPKKKIKGLEMLSGGERALTSIALLFAISQVNPPPFIILDETDAALDEANSNKYGNMIENLAKHSQLILITHNRETMSRAGVLYGVTMERNGVSKILSIAFEEAVLVAK
jgi:chromosome segregation protein